MSEKKRKEGILVLAMAGKKRKRRKGILIHARSRNLQLDVENFALVARRVGQQRDANCGDHVTHL